MKQLQILTVLIIFVFVSDILSYGQYRSKMSNADKSVTQPNKLAGTWKIIEYTDFDSVTA